MYHSKTQRAFVVVGDANLSPWLLKEQRNSQYDLHIEKLSHDSGLFVSHAIILSNEHNVSILAGAIDVGTTHPL